MRMTRFALVATALCAVALTLVGCEAKSNASATVNIGPTGIPLPQCKDGEDNDKDGKIDLADPGCRDGNDNDESDDPTPPPAPLVPPTPPPTPPPTTPTPPPPPTPPAASTAFCTPKRQDARVGALVRITGQTSTNVYQWEALEGDPRADNDNFFDTRFNGPGEKTVTLRNGAGASDVCHVVVSGSSGGGPATPTPSDPGSGTPPPPPPPPPPGRTITLTPGSGSGAVNTTTSTSAVCTGGSCNAPWWSSSDPSRVSVNPISGLVRYIWHGSATICVQWSVTETSPKSCGTFTTTP